MSIIKRITTGTPAQLQFGEIATDGVSIWFGDPSEVVQRVVTVDSNTGGSSLPGYLTIDPPSAGIGLCIAGENMARSSRICVDTNTNLGVLTSCPAGENMTQATFPSVVTGTVGCGTMWLEGTQIDANGTICIGTGRAGGQSSKVVRLGPSMCVQTNGNICATGLNAPGGDIRGRCVNASLCVVSVLGSISIIDATCICSDTNLTIETTNGAAARLCSNGGGGTQVCATSAVTISAGNNIVLARAPSPTTNTANVRLTSGKLLRCISSSCAFKCCIKTHSIDTSSILDIKVKEYQMRSSPDEARNLIGLIAEEVQTNYPELVSYNDSGNPDNVEYNSVMLLQIEELAKRNRALEQQVDYLTKKLEKI